MRKGKSVIGKDVLTLAEGRRLQTVKDLIISGDDAEVIGLLVDEGGLLSSSLVVPMEQVRSIGSDAVVIEDANAVLPAAKYPRVNEIIDRKERLVGKKVYTERGSEHGTISDVYFDEQTGRILGFEVTGGVFNDVTRGNSYLPVDDIVRMGPEVVYIQQRAVAVMDAQVGGVQGALQGAGDRLGQGASAARDRVAGAGQDARDRLGQTGQGARDRLTQAGSDAQARIDGASERGRTAMDTQRFEESLVGRRVSRDVTDDQGGVIVAANQRIEPDHLETARAGGKTRDLAAAAAAAQFQEFGANVGDAAGTAGDTAGSLWDAFTRKLSEVTDATGKRVDEERTKKRLSDIEDAVGRPVSKVILDRDDNVILNLGDIITHEAVQKAYDAGGLDTLLGSVYKGEVSFDKEEMKVHGRAATTAITIERASGEAPILDELQQKVEQAQQERDTQREASRTQADSDRQRRERERDERARQRESGASQRTTEAGEDKAAIEAARSRSGTAVTRPVTSTSSRSRPS